MDSRTEATRTLINRSLNRRAAGFFVVLATIAQALLPATLAVAGSGGTDLAHFFCAPSGQLSAEAQAAAAQLAELAGDEASDRQSSDGHCPLCALVAGMALPEPAGLAVRPKPAAEKHHQRYAPHFAHGPQGPPLGSRGPPLHL